MSRRVVTTGHAGGGGLSLSERFAGLSQARAHGSASHIPRSSDRGGRGGGRRPSDRGVSKPQGQRQQRDDRQGSRDGRGRGRGRGKSQRGGRDGGKSRDGKDKKKKPVTTDDLDKDLDKYFARDPEMAKANLDADLDDFMKKRDDGDGEPAQ